MAFAKIAKRNNKTPTKPHIAAIRVITNSHVRDEGIPFPHQAAVKCKRRQNRIRHWFPNNCLYAVHSV